MTACEPITMSTAKPTVLCIGGLDSSGIAGLSMDTRTCSAVGVHAAVVATANTAQSSSGFYAVNPCSLEVLQSQLAAAEDLNPRVVKIGYIASAQQVDFLASWLSERDVFVVYDPVLGSSGGECFADQPLLRAITTQLLPVVDCLTPNIAELGLLADASPVTQPFSELAVTETEVIEAVSQRARAECARGLLQAGCASIVAKGGHADGEQASDYFCSSSTDFWLHSPWQAAANSRGTGCAFASALAGAMAQAYGISDAVVMAKMIINQALMQSYSLNGQAGPVAAGGRFLCQSLVPKVSDGQAAFKHKFPSVDDQQPLGLYPVVDQVAWLERLLPLGITTIQLRIKSMPEDQLSAQIQRAVAISNQYRCRLFINDHWQLAIKHKAYGVHLGQEDLSKADLRAIHNAGLRLGISTHCHYEVARAHQYNPSYIAIGPIYQTTSKDMPWRPQGAAALRYWRECLDYPLVAIGGINAERLCEVLEAGADGIAMISAITGVANPEQATRELMVSLSEQ